MTTALHVPVMLEETMNALQIKKGETYIDGTFGRGGHTSAMIERGAKVVAFDHDEQAVLWGRDHFAPDIAAGVLSIEYENFDKLGEVAALQNKKVAGALFDFGVSSDQLEEANRGFSFQEDAPLDMRMDNRLGVTARDLVNALGRKELFMILTKYAQEHRARMIVEGIMAARSVQPIETTKQLADIVEKSVGGRKRNEHLHPATKTFMALRIVVNDELGNIERALPAAFALLQDKARLVTISFHEGEDRIVKHQMKTWEEEGLGIQVTKKPLEPSYEEVQANPRSRSAKLRIFEKGGSHEA